MGNNSQALYDLRLQLSNLETAITYLEMVQGANDLLDQMLRFKIDLKQQLHQETQPTKPHRS